MNDAWTTKDEIRFIEYLNDAGGKTALEGYLAGCMRRMKWDDIDPYAVIDVIKKFLWAA